MKYGGFILFALGLSFAALAHAQVSSQSIADALLARTSFAADAVALQDQALYARLNLESRFGLRFNLHIAVCPDSGAEAHCDARVITDQSGQPLAAAKIVSGYGPAQFLKAYSLTGQASGHPVVALVDAYNDPNIVSDLATYSKTFNLPLLPACSGAIASSKVACFAKVNQSGQTRLYPPSNSGWALEIALDVEVAHATCQNCSILLVEANSNSYANLMAAEDRAVAMGATVVSNSWGSSEFSTEKSYDSHFTHPGVAFTVSAGDNGYGTEYPAASPYVTAVGGTSLFLNANGSYNSEMAWSGTGSGCSVYETKPSFQHDPRCTRRTIADVSADADPNTGAAVYDSVRYATMSGWFQVGGTSLSSPLVAAVYAQSGNTAGASNAIPYGTPAALHDITSGSNGSCGGSYLCTALAGFDGPTGLGTPNGVGAF